MATPGRGTQPGFVFAAPFKGPGQYGPLILDNAGEPVWCKPIEHPTAMDFRVQRYRGQDVLTWWQGKVEGGYGGGTGLIFDREYQRVARVKAGSRGTALVAIYNSVEADLSGVGGPVDGNAVEGVIQEIDIHSGRVLFEWHSLDHVPLDQSYRIYPTDPGHFDYFHLNSIAVDADGHLLVSARHTSTVYKVDRRSGEIMWRLGGKKSNFAMGPGASFNFQHDARRHIDGTITLFDNGAFGAAEGEVVSFSRPLRLRVDPTAMTASVVDVYQPVSRDSRCDGGPQQLSGGGVFVGCGTAGSFTEFTLDRTVAFDASFADQGLSYRVFRYPWVGDPTVPPDVVTTRASQDKTTIRVSWNGATKVARWRVLRVAGEQAPASPGRPTHGLRERRHYASADRMGLSGRTRSQRARPRCLHAGQSVKEAIAPRSAGSSRAQVRRRALPRRSAPRLAAGLQLARSVVWMSVRQARRLEGWLAHR